MVLSSDDFAAKYESDQHNIIADQIEINEKFIKLFESRPISGLADHDDLIAEWQTQILGLVLPVVEARVFSNNFESADSLLQIAFSNLIPDSPEAILIFNTRMELVDQCVSKSNFKLANILLDRAYNFYPPTSKERRIVVDRGLTLFNSALAHHDLVTAGSLLDRAHNYYPLGTKSIQALIQRFQFKKDRSNLFQRQSSFITTALSGPSL